MTLSASQVAAHFRKQEQQLRPIVASYRGLQKEIREADSALAKQVEAARRDLASVYLPELSDAAFERVARLTGFQGFARRDPRTALEHERHVLEQAIAKIDSDPRYQNREVAVLQLQQELDNARDTLAPLDAECQKFETQLGFMELVQIGYDTPSFKEKWWHASYWKHWATGDRICKALDMKDFGDDVLPAYNKNAEPRNFMRDEVERLSRQIDAIHELVRERDFSADRLAHLGETYLHESQDYLGEHLENADAALLEQWIAAEPTMQRAVQIGLRKLAGLTAKRRFLADINNEGIGYLVTQLEQRQRKAATKAMKFQRPKYQYATYADTVVPANFDDKAAALDQQRAKMQRRIAALMAAEDYAGFDLRNDQELWWVYFMHQPPPRLAPSLFDYYRKRPGVTPITDPDYVDAGPSPAEAAAMAYAAGELEQGGYLS